MFASEVETKAIGQLQFCDDAFLMRVQLFVSLGAESASSILPLLTFCSFQVLVEAVGTEHLVVFLV